ncbi:MAG: DUF234 domain-containing protein [Lactobacillales bacterium]|nr:DUF234 domain-containing protein [Lactobacillales bacterium]
MCCERGLTKIAMKRIEPHFAKFMGEVWEEICIEWLWEQVKKERIGDVFFEIGSWWGNNPIKKREEEIDILAVADKTFYFGECKWKEEFINKEVLDKLIYRSHLPVFSLLNKEYYLFSKSGFSSDILAQKQDNIHLISLKNIFE